MTRYGSHPCPENEIVHVYSLFLSILVVVICVFFHILFNINLQ